MKTSTNRKRTGWPLTAAALLVFSFLLLMAAPAMSSPAPGGMPAFGDLPQEDTSRHRITIGEVPREMGHVHFFDEETILYVSGNCLYLTSLREGGPEREFRGHSGSIHDYKVMPDRRSIVTASADGTLRLWDIPTGECVAVSEQLDTLSQPFWTMLNEIVLEPEGRTLMTSDMEGLKVWSAGDLKLVAKEEADYFYMTTGLISPDWKTVSAPVPESYDDCAVFEPGSGNILLYLDNRYPLCYSPDGGRLLAANMETGAMEIHDIDPRAPQGRFSGVWVSSSRIPLKDAVFSPDGRILASAQAGGVICLWDTRDGTGIDELRWEGQAVDGICFDTKGERILAFNTEDGEYCIWDLPSGDASTLSGSIPQGNN